MSTIPEIRRLLLQAIVNERGLANIARLAGKPASQIKDMLEKRKAFGDKVAREIGPKIAPERPADWLLTPRLPAETPETHCVSDVESADYIAETSPAAPENHPANTVTIDQLNTLLSQINIIKASVEAMIDAHPGYAGAPKTQKHSDALDSHDFFEKRPRNDKTNII